MSSPAKSNATGQNERPPGAANSDTLPWRGRVEHLSGAKVIGVG